MKLTCPSCGSPILAEDVSVDSGIAKCRQCNEVINVFQTLGIAPPKAPSPVAGHGELLPRPPRMIVDDQGENWSIGWSWLEPSYFFMLLFCIAWDSFLVFWYSMALTDKKAPWLMVVFPIAHVGVGVGMTYSVVAGFLNRTRIGLRDANLFVRHGPVFWIGNKQVPIENIDQLYCRRAASSTRSSNGVGARHDYIRQYELWAVLKGGGETFLVRVKNLGEGRFLEQQIEERLGIEPRHVVGEATHD